MVWTQRRRLTVRRTKPLLAGSAVMVGGVARMVLRHPMVSIDAARMERDAEADKKTTHGIEARNEIDLTR